MTTFTITVQDEAVSEMLAKLSARVGNMAPYLQAIGEDIVERTKQRFGTSTAPDGKGWTGYSPVDCPNTPSQSRAEARRRC